MSDEIEGKWWLADFPDSKFEGTLRIDEDSLSLKINTLKRSISFEDIFVDIVLGESNSGEKITLYKNSVTDAVTEVYIISTFMIIGSHYTSENELLFKQISFHFSNVVGWIGKDVFKVNNQDPEKLLISVSGYTLDFSLNGYKLNLVFNPTYEIRGVSSLKSKQIPKFTLDAREVITLSELVNIVESLQDFFILLMGRIIHPYGFRLSDQNNKEFSLLYQGKSERIKENQFEDFINFKAIESELKNLVKNWFSKSDKLRLPSSLFLGLVYVESIYIEYKLIAFAQLIEAFHRRIYNGNYKTEEEYKTIYETIVKAIPTNIGSLGESLKNKLVYGNEYSLRKRLNELMKDNYEEYFKSFIFNKNLFVDKVIETRNYLIHNPKNKKNESIVEDKDLVFLNYQLQFMCHLLLLKEIGVSPEILKGFIKYSSTKRTIEFLNKKMYEKKTKS